MYQYRSGLLPYSFNNMFSVTHQVHSCGTRSSELFHLPQCRTNIRKFSISFQGPKFLNNILLVLKFEMQQVPLRFVVSWKHSSHLKYSLKYTYICFFVPLCFYPNYDQYDYLICFKIYSSSAIFPLWNHDFVLIIYLREPIPYKPAGFFWTSSPSCTSYGK